MTGRFRRKSVLGGCRVAALLLALSSTAVLATTPSKLSVRTDGAAGTGRADKDDNDAITGQSQFTLSDEDWDRKNRPGILDSLKLGSMVRIHILSRGNLTGRLKEKSDTSITLSGEAREVYVSAASIDALWVRGNAKETGAKIGGIVGLVIGLTVASKSKRKSNIADVPDFAERSTGTKIVYGLAYAVGGGVLGAAIGQKISTWQLSYHAPSSDHRPMSRPGQRRGSLTDGPTVGLRLAISLPF